MDLEDDILRLFGFLAVVFLLAGCASYSQLFVNSSGELMSCSATGQGLIGAAVASHSVSECSNNMRAAGYIEIEQAGVMGIQFSDSPSDSGVKAIKVFRPSPADSAGVKAGDFLIEVDHQTVKTRRDAQALAFGIAGTPLSLVLMRGPQRMDFTLIRAPYVKIFGRPAK